MNLQLFKINNETILPIVIYGKNRSDKVTEYHKKVMVDYFNIPMNYIECHFPAFSHGFVVNQVIKNTIDSVDFDYYWFCDHDSIILKEECVDIMYSSIRNKKTIFGQATQSNHKKGPNGMIPHAYASQAFLGFSKDLYIKLLRPDMDHWSEQNDEWGGDTCEKLTYEAKKKGYIVSLMYPSYSVLPNTDLDNGCKFGMGNFYGPDLCYHSMQQNNPQSEIEFIKVCEKVLNGEYK